MKPSDTSSTARQSDLLQVRSGTSVVPVEAETLLERMGFRVVKRSDQHWLVTGNEPLPELHFYTHLELGRFALNRAHQYRQWLNGRQHHDKVADLPG